MNFETNNGNSFNQKKSGSLSEAMANPILKSLKTKLSKSSGSETVMTYRGVFGKTLFFIVLAFIGAAIAIIMNATLPKNIMVNDEPAINSLVLLIMTITALAMIGLSIASVFVRGKALCVLGAISMACIGFSLCAATAIRPDYSSALLLALALTFFLVIALLILYSSGKFRVTPKMRRVVYTCLFGCLIVAVFSLACRLIPALNGIPEFFARNPALGIIGGIIGVVIATLFLMTDFDSIKNAVDGGAPKEYEWLAAYGLAFSIMWVFLKIFQLILRSRNAGDSSK